MTRHKHRTFGSKRFIALTRNPKLKPPTKFVPTRKASGDVVI
jgi:hypothetical protein